MTVEDLGWDDWLLLPQVFDYHYCQGSCTKAKISPYTSLLRKLNSQPCCAPTELSNMRVLYIKENSIYDKVIKNFMTKGCACGGIAGLSSAIEIGNRQLFPALAHEAFEKVLV